MVTIAEDIPITPDQLSALFKASGIIRPYEDLERLEKMIDHCDFLITAWDDGELIGIARGLTDYSYCCYLSDLAVDKSYQSQGIGKKLLERTTKIIGKNVTLVLRSSAVAMDFYPKAGLQKADNCFIIPKVE